MAKYPKFLAAENRMADPGVIYVVHTQKPRFLAIVKGISVEIIDDIDNIYDYYCGDISKIDGLLKRTIDWYKSYTINILKNGNR